MDSPWQAKQGSDSVCVHVCVCGAFANDVQTDCAKGSFNFVIIW